MTPRIGLARNTARNLIKELKIITPPVFLSPIIKHLKFNASPYDLNEDISGIQVTMSDECFILYNKSDHVHRKRFTVAHEIGNFLLNHTNYKQDYFDLFSKDSMEIEANQFAAELLIPLEFLKEELKGWKKAKELALKFWVSKTAMDWRLRETGLYTKLLSWD